MNAAAAHAALQDAIRSYKGHFAPCAWAASNNNGIVLLEAHYEAQIPSEDGWKGGEPWMKCGGHAILAASGCTFADSGMDGYEDEFGIRMIVEWIRVEVEEDDE